MPCPSDVTVCVGRQSSRCKGLDGALIRATTLGKTAVISMIYGRPPCRNDATHPVHTTRVLGPQDMQSATPTPDIHAGWLPSSANISTRRRIQSETRRPHRSDTGRLAESDEWSRARRWRRLLPEGGRIQPRRACQRATPRHDRVSTARTGAAVYDMRRGSRTHAGVMHTPAHLRGL